MAKRLKTKVILNDFEIKCPKHQNQKALFYCQDDKIYACQKCLIKTHLGHDVKDSYSILKKESTNALIDDSIVSIDIAIESYKSQKEKINRFSKFHIRNIKRNQKNTIRLIK
jgi:B-box zinc finger